MEKDYIVYRLTAPNKSYYVGITNNLKRRLKEHRTSKYAIGRAIRKYGINNFDVEIVSDNLYIEEALKMEEDMIGEREVKSKNCYNLCLGGVISNTLLSGLNPMKDPEIVAKHPTLFSTEYNPMFDQRLKQRMIDSQNTKKVIIGDVEYYGVREAARQLEMSRQKLIHRLNSKNFPDHNYLG
ncbi:GIY-YIG nuclease family protein [bacterium]|nr:GIY-YIG nuclease family protein [bacterium]